MQSAINAALTAVVAVTAEYSRTYYRPFLAVLFAGLAAERVAPEKENYIANAALQVAAAAVMLKMVAKVPNETVVVVSLTSGALTLVKGHFSTAAASLSSNAAKLVSPLGMFSALGSKGVQ